MLLLHPGGSDNARNITCLFGQICHIVALSHSSKFRECRRSAWSSKPNRNASPHSVTFTNVHVRSPLDVTVIVDCKGDLQVRIHRRLLLDDSAFFAQELRHCIRQFTSGIHILRTRLPRRTLRRYALWLYGSSDYAIFDPSLNALELFLELSDLRKAAGALQDEGFGNDVMSTMITHLITHFDKMLLETFLAEFL